MGRGDFYRYDIRKKESAKKRALHPIWRGIGCLILSGLAIGGYFVGGILLEENSINSWIPIPSKLMTIPYLPMLPEGLWIQLVIAFLFMVFGYGLLSLIYAIIFPIQPDEYDAPPPKYSSH
jgi:polyferredoxin